MVTDASICIPIRIVVEPRSKGSHASSEHNTVYIKALEQENGLVLLFNARYKSFGGSGELVRSIWFNSSCLVQAVQSLKI